MEPTKRLALMIDGDNAQAALLPQILAEVSKYGVMIIRRVYGDWSKPELKGWRDTLLEYALKPEQQFSNTTGKNATDIALIIDAMDIIYTAGVDGICIVSSDSDYTRLAARIREKNLFVMGIGEKKTPRAFVNACNVFVHTENLKPVAEDSEVEIPVPAPAPKPAPAATSKPVPAPASKPRPAPTAKGAPHLADLERLLRTAFDTAVQEDGWAHLGTMGSVLRQIDPAFDPRTYGHTQLLQLVKAHPKLIEVKKDASKGGTHYVRMKSKKPTQKAKAAQPPASK